MVDTTIKYRQKYHNRYGSLKLNNFAQKYPAKLKTAFGVVASIVTTQITDNLSGKSHTKFPGNPNPYPGVLTGTMRRSITWKRENGGMGIRITHNGTAKEYIYKQNAMRPFMLPSFNQVEDRVWATLRKFLKRSFR